MTQPQPKQVQIPEIDVNATVDHLISQVSNLSRESAILGGKLKSKDVYIQVLEARVLELDKQVKELQSQLEPVEVEEDVKEIPDEPVTVVKSDSKPTPRR